MRDPYVLTLKTGKTLTLRYPFSALRRYEKLSGGGHFFSDSLHRLGADYLINLIAAGVGPHCKPDDVEKNLDDHLEAGGDIPSIMNQTTEALKQWGVLSRDEEEEPNEEGPTEATDPGD
jgi:hypothetical protein